MPFDAAHFVTLDRQDGSSRAGAEISKAIGTGRTDLRLDAHAQYLDPDYGIGGYAVVPGGYSSALARSASYLGNVEAGAMFVLADTEERRFAAHVGAALPTYWTIRHNAPDAKPSNFSPRQTDIPQDLPGGGVRGGITWQGREGRTFSQLDIGFDLLIGSSPAAGDPSHEWRALHVNAGFGVDLGGPRLTIETVNRFAAHTFDGGAVGIRFDAGPVQPYAAVSIGLVQIASDEVYGGVTLGVDAAL